MAQLEDVQTDLARQQRELETEINDLRVELKKDQDPNRIQIIQELISVGTKATSTSGCTRTNLQVRTFYLK